MPEEISKTQSFQWGKLASWSWIILPVTTILIYILHFVINYAIFYRFDLPINLISFGLVDVLSSIGFTVVVFIFFVGLFFSIIGFLVILPPKNINILFLSPIFSIIMVLCLAVAYAAIIGTLNFWMGVIFIMAFLLLILTLPYKINLSGEKLKRLFYFEAMFVIFTFLIMTPLQEAAVNKLK